MSLYIGNISSSTRESEFRELFRKHGELSRCEIKRGYGFVDFVDEENVEDAIKELDNYELDGRKLIVEKSKSKPRRGGASNDECFKCRKPGHWAKDCDERGRDYYDDRRDRRGRYDDYDRRDSYRRRDRSYSRDRYRSPRRSRRDRSHSRGRYYESRYRDDRRRSRTPPSRRGRPSPNGRSRSPVQDKSPRRRSVSPNPRNGSKLSPQHPKSPVEDKGDSNSKEIIKEIPVEKNETGINHSDSD